ncbi:hypothetical protein B0H16DRAFT_1452491 [Mycena metata]|uniref:Uncharacterized protein n=1 Tax=Mycena metata TaxID=1033252 RepID=A0AAD7JSF2_9AGAR|nr:hypothetical protein B0H16DRAFT_1452491 [Mycena metata]
MLFHGFLHGLMSLLSFSSRLIIAIAPIRLGLIPIVPISPLLLGPTPFLSISLSGLHWMTTHNYRLYSCVADIGYPVLSPPPSNLLGLGSGHSPSRSQRLTDEDGDLGTEKSHAESTKKKGKKAKVHNTDSRNEEQEKDKGHTVGGTGRSARRSGKQPAKNPNNNSGQSTGAGGSAPAKSRPRPRPLLTAERREGRLLHLSNFGPYRSLVFDLLRLSPESSATTTTVKTSRPTWLTWEIKDVQIGADFFDKKNQAGYLPNWQAVASDILLIIGLTYYAGKQVAEAEPEDPVYVFPFEVSDLEKVEGTIKSMLAQTKKLFKFGVSMYRSIDKDWKKVCLKSGKAPQSLAAEPFPEALHNWSRQLDVDVLPLHRRPRILIVFWRKPGAEEGRGGLSVVLGMKWWRLSLDGPGDEDQLVWASRVRELTANFKLLAEAKSIKRPESRRGPMNSA